MLNQNGLKAEMKMFGFPDRFIEQGTRIDLFRMYKLDSDSLIHEILMLLEKQTAFF